MLKNIRIAVIDSGICEVYLKENKNIIGGIGFQRNSENNEIEQVNEYFDKNGHGTNCVDIINRTVEGAKFYIVKILDENGYSDSEILKRSLIFLLDKDIDIINLSISVSKQDDQELIEICDMLVKKNKVLVASVENGKTVSVPAKFKNVYGVIGDLMKNKYKYVYSKCNEVELICDATPVITKGIENKYNLFGGNSKATCLGTAIIAQILIQQTKFYKHNDLYTNINNSLIDNAIFSNKDYKCLKGIPKFSENEDINNIETSLNINFIIQCFCKLYGNEDVDSILSNRLYEFGEGIDLDGILSIIRRIEIIEQVKIDFHTLSLKDLEWVSSFIKFLEKNADRSGKVE